jgi:hypothetical protein
MALDSPVNKLKGLKDDHPLTAPAIRPFITYFWNIIVMMIAGRMIATDAAITAPHATSTYERMLFPVLLVFTGAVCQAYPAI